MSSWRSPEQSGVIENFYIVGRFRSFLLWMIASPPTWQFFKKKTHVGYLCQMLPSLIATTNNPQIPSPDKQFSEFEPITITFHGAVMTIEAEIILKPAQYLRSMVS